MKIVECTKCGSNELFEEFDYVICAYCRLKYVPSQEGKTRSESVISISEDVQNLLKKCRDDPKNRNRFVRLILDIDPTNAEVAKYL